MREIKSHLPADNAHVTASQSSSAKPAQPVSVSVVSLPKSKEQASADVKKKQASASAEASNQSKKLQSVSVEASLKKVNNNSGKTSKVTSGVPKDSKQQPVDQAWLQGTNAHVTTKVRVTLII